MKTRVFVAAVLAIFVVGATLRMLWLRDDPPVTDTGIVFHDEGAWTHNARNKALWGQWVTDQWNPVYVAPVFMALEYAAFREFGVGTWQARTVPVASGLLAVAFLMAGLASAGSRRAALIGGALLATNFVFVSWNRAALMESTMTAFIVTAWGAYAMAERRPWWGLVAGVATILAYFTKASGVFFVVAIGADALYTYLTTRSRGALYTLAGATAAGLVILVAFVWPHWTDYFNYNIVMSVERKPIYTLKALMDRASLLPLAQNFYTQMWPVVYCAAIAIVGIVGRWRSEPPSHRLLAWWVLLAFFELIAHDSTNSRRHVMMIPAFIALSALWIEPRTPVLPAEVTPSFWQRVWLAPIALYLGYVVMGSLDPMLWANDIAAGRYSHAVWKSALFGAGLGLSLLVGWKRFSRVAFPARVTLTVMVMVIGWNGYKYADWARTRTDLNYRASVALGQILPPGTLVQGKLANGLDLENRIKPIFIGNDFGNYADRFQRDDVRYILTYVLPYEGYESGKRDLKLISEILDRYPAVGPATDRHPIATFEVQETPGLDRAALFDKFRVR